MEKDFGVFPIIFNENFSVNNKHTIHLGSLKSDCLHFGLKSHVPERGCDFGALTVYALFL